MRIVLVRAAVVLLVACISGFGSSPAYSQNYLIDLGTVAPALGINNSGQVVLQNYIYSSGTITPLPAGMTGAAINNGGDVAGSITSGSQPCTSLQGWTEMPSGGNCEVALYSGGALTQYPQFNSSNLGEGINDSGTIVGTWNGTGSGTTAGLLTITGGAESNVSAVTSAGLNCPPPAAINDAGQIVANCGAVFAFLITPQGGTINLGQGEGFAINATNTVAGYALIAGPPDVEGDVSYYPVGAFFVPGISNAQIYSVQRTTIAYSINNSGFMVGDFNIVAGNPPYQGLGAPTADYRAFIYNGAATATDLNDMVLPSDPLKPYVTLQDAHGINDSGLIVANGVDSRTNMQHSYLLQVPLILSGPLPIEELNYGTGQSIGNTSAPQAATFTNYGTTSIVLGGVSVSASFSVQSNSCGSSLAPGATCSVSVVFTPTTAGTSSGNLTLIAAGMPINVPVTGAAPVSGVTLKASATTVTLGAPVTLTWTSTPGASCTATGGDAPGPITDGWSGSLASSGSISVLEKLVGTYAYGISCTGSGTQATKSAQATVVVTSPVVTVTSSSHGGGAFDWISEILLLGMLGFHTYRQLYRSKEIH